MPTIKTVALLGADGKLGPTVLTELSAHFQVTVLKRESSKSSDAYPSQGAPIKVTRIPDGFSLDDLTKALRGQDAIVVTVPGSELDLQKRLADAAVAAGVKHFIPADFGSCDSASKRACELVPLYGEKSSVREYLTNLANEHPGFAWTSIVCAHFFDWSWEFLHVYMKERRVDILDDGETRWSASTLQQVARSVVAVLQKADRQEIRNKMVYVQSFCITQNQVVQALERVSGQKWEVKKFDSGEFVKEQVKKRDEGDKAAINQLVWWLGVFEANWEGKKYFVNKLLELPDESLDEVLKAHVSTKS